MIKFDISDIITLLLPEAVHERFPFMLCTYNPEMCTLHIRPTNDPTGEFEYLDYITHRVENNDAARQSLNTVLRMISTMGVLHTHPDLTIKLAEFTGRNTHMGRVVAAAGACLHQLFHGQYEEPVQTSMFLYHTPGWMSPHVTITSLGKDEGFVLMYKDERVELSPHLQREYLEYMQSDAVEWPGTADARSQFISDIETVRKNINDLLALEGL